MKLKISLNVLPDKQPASLTRNLEPVAFVQPEKRPLTSE